MWFAEEFHQHTVRAAFVSVFVVSRLLFLRYMTALLPMRGVRLNFDSAAVSGNVQVIPVDTVTTRAQFYSHLSFYTEVFGQALLLLFGTRIGATHKKNQTNK